MLKVAVVGAGTMGSVHSLAYTRSNAAELVGIVDLRAEVGQGLATQCATDYYPTLEALLEHHDPDVVDICLPTYLHRSYVERVAAIGKHVICEKPIARTLEDAAAMISACESAGVRFFIGHVLRFFPEYQQIKSIVRDGQLGNIGTVRTFRGGSFPAAWNDWYANVEASGSLVVDLAIHDFDFLRWCFGKVSRVFGKSVYGRDLNRLDHTLASLRFENGIIAHVEGSWAEPYGFRTALEIAGSNGIVAHDSENSISLSSKLQTGASSATGVSVPESPLVKSPYQVELEHFFDCIESGRESIVTPNDAYHALEISLAVLQSIRTGEVVTL